MAKQFSRGWKTSTKLFTLARFIEKNRAQFNMGKSYRCIWGMGEWLITGDAIGRDFYIVSEVFGITQDEAYSLNWGKFNRINPQFPDIRTELGGHTDPKLPCEVLRFLAKEYRKEGK